MVNAGEARGLGRWPRDGQALRGRPARQPHHHDHRAHHCRLRAAHAKTSSRAITSPAGTVRCRWRLLAPVALDVAQIRRVVDNTGGCIVWGGAVRLGPADDILIRVERPLDLDSQGPAGGVGAVQRRLPPAPPMC